MINPKKRAQIKVGPAAPVSRNVTPPANISSLDCWRRAVEKVFAPEFPAACTLMNAAASLSFISFNWQTLEGDRVSIVVER